MLGRALTARGYRVCFVVIDSEQGLPNEVDGIDIRPVQRSARTPALVLALRFARAVASASSHVVVQRAASRETGMTALVARGLGRRFVYSSANVIDFDYARLEPKKINVWGYELGVRIASGVVVQTDEQAALARRQFGRQASVIRSVAAPAAPAAPAASRDAFLWIGRQVSYKRPEDFLRLAEALPHARFGMLSVPSTGPGGERGAEMRERAAALGNVEWLAPRPHAEVLELMNSAVAIVNTADYEGMPNIFLEGWARGVPALALHHDPDGVIERERLGAFAGGHFERLVAAAAELWKGRDRPAEAAGRCRAYIAANHDVSVVVEQWIDALGLRRTAR
jgi:glycosyltransferase involved in cell wall biosynthesis